MLVNSFGELIYLIIRSSKSSVLEPACQVKNLTRIPLKPVYYHHVTHQQHNKKQSIHSTFTIINLYQLLFADKCIGILEIGKATSSDMTRRQRLPCRTDLSQ